MIDSTGLGACRGRRSRAVGKRSAHAARRRTIQGTPTHPSPWNQSSRLRDVELIDTAIIGAGPFGLSIAAHLSRILNVIMFGEPMRTWRTLMPPDMLLRSDWETPNMS